MDPGASFSIRNTDGAIRVYGASIDQLKVYATKRAYQKERLEKIAINVTPRPNSIAIETVYPPKPKLGLSDRSGTVDYVIILPQHCAISRLELVNGEVLVEGMRGKQVNVNLVNGRFISHNCYADSTFFVANGAMDIGYDWPEDRKIALDAKLLNGNMRVYIAAGASFHVLATTPNGHIASEFTAKEDRHGPIKKMDATIGAAVTLELKLHATHGGIRLAVATP